MYKSVVSINNKNVEKNYKDNAGNLHLFMSPFCRSSQKWTQMQVLN